MRSISKASLLLLFGLFAAGTYWAFDRGGGDFSVFYVAWRHVLAGDPMVIYEKSPDRYLYHPGFAWFFAPLGYLPFSAALAVWTLSKAVLLGAFCWRAGSHLFGKGAWGLAALGAVLLSKPLLIDLQYGQINSIILFVLALTIMAFYQARSQSQGSGGWKVGASWALASILAFTKLFSLPLLLVPFVLPPRWSTRPARLGILIGVTLITLLPFVFLGPAKGLQLYHSWIQSVVDKGFPLETHNQSFPALLFHYFSGNPSPVISFGRREVPMGFALFSEQTMTHLALSWSLLCTGFLILWLLRERRDPVLWSAVSLATLILAPHLVWKAYFVFGIPLAAVAIRDASVDLRAGKAMRMVVLSAIFVGVNFSGFDFVGRDWSARLEGASLLLLMHLALVLIVLFGSKRNLRELTVT